MAVRLPTRLRPPARDRRGAWRRPLPAQAVSAALAIALIAVGGTGAAAEEEASDPFVWVQPAILPAPVAVLDEGEYARRRDELLVGVDLAALAASGTPAAGLELIDVKAGGSAAALGIEVGDVWLAIDGQPLRFIEDVDAQRHLELAQTMTFWSSKAGRHDLAVGAGRMGVTYVPAWYPACGYLASAGRGAAWDREVVTAAFAFRRDPALALTALAHAQAAGYAGIYLRPLQACACLGLGRSHEALAAAEAGLPALPFTERAVLIHAMYSAAVLDGRLAEARSVLARLHRDTSGFAPFLADHAARLARHAGSADPLAITPTTPRHDLIAMTRMTLVLDGSDQGQALRDVADGADTLDATCEIEKWVAFEFATPTVGWLSYELTFDVTFPDHSPGNLTCGLGDPHDTLRTSVNGWVLDTLACTVGIQADRSVSVGLQRITGSSTPLATRQPAARHHLTVALRDDQAGFALDGLRLGVVPVLGGTTGRSLYLFASGCHMIVRGIAIAAHDPQPPAGWVERTKPNQKAAEGPPGKTGADGF